MADGRLEKPEKIYTEQVDALLPQVDSVVEAGNLQEGIDSLLALEKQTRNAADLQSTSRLLNHTVKVCFVAGNWKALNENVLLLSKKHGQLKQAITSMVKEAMSYLDKTPDMSTKLELIETLKSVTDGKIYVEVERARLTRMLSKIKEDEGNIDEAADILQELQVETFGSMERREKTEFLLDQMRLCLAKNDYTRTQITSKKINTRFFKEAENQDLKLLFYKLMIQYAMHEKEYLEVCKYYHAVYDTPSIQEDQAKWSEVLENIIFFVILSPYDNEQSDLLHRVAADPNLNKLPVHRDFVKCFTTPELMRWPRIEEIYGSTLRQSSVFKRGDAEADARWQELHQRVIEHNIRVVAKYYTKITTQRLSQLLDLPPDESESFLSRLVVSKTIYAKIDRPAGLISFAAPRDINEILNGWSADINSLLGLVEKTCHLITKEEMVNKIAKVM